MSTINQELLGLLQEEVGTGKTQVYWLVARKCEATGLPRAQAAIALAMEFGIDVSKYATEYDLETIRKSEPGLVSMIEGMLSRKKEIAQAIKETQSQETIRDPYVDSKMLAVAYKNAEVCAKLFIFENSLRRVVSAVMEKEYGIDWWYDVTPRDIMYSTFDRRSGEKEPKWRGQFGAEPIYYTDIKDLSEIINNRQEAFRKVLGKKLSIATWINLVERIRTALVHSNPVTQKELDKFAVIFKQWNKIAWTVHKNLAAN